MSTPFETALLAEVESWIGTPFAHRAKVKGVGVDCVHFAGEVMTACGVVKSYDFGPYSLDWSMHRDLSLIEHWLDWHREFERFRPPPPARIGDLALFRIGRCTQHLGIMLDETVFAHVLNKGRVCHGQLDDPTWSARLALIYRPRAVTAPQPQPSTLA